MYNLYLTFTFDISWLSKHFKKTSKGAEEQLDGIYDGKIYIRKKNICQTEL